MCVELAICLDKAILKTVHHCDSDQKQQCPEISGVAKNYLTRWLGEGKY